MIFKGLDWSKFWHNLENISSLLKINQHNNVLNVSSQNKSQFQQFYHSCTKRSCGHNVKISVSVLSPRMASDWFKAWHPLSSLKMTVRCHFQKKTQERLLSFFVMILSFTQLPHTAEVYVVSHNFCFKSCTRYLLKFMECIIAWEKEKNLES